MEQPSVADTVAILRGLKDKYEGHHGVTIADSALVAAAALSHRYISDRFLPDKAIEPDPTLPYPYPIPTLRPYVRPTAALHLPLTSPRRSTSSTRRRPSSAWTPPPARRS